MQGGQFMRRMLSGTLTEGVPREKWARAQARNWRVLPWKYESERGQTPRPHHFGELKSGPCGCCYNSMPWYSQHCCLSAHQSELNSTRQEGADSHPLPHIATTFPWIMVLWPHHYTPWGGSFSVSKWNVCLSWASLLADWSQHPCQHPAHPKGHRGPACKFALSVAHRFTPEGSLNDRKCYMSSSEYNFAKT